MLVSVEKERDRIAGAYTRLICWLVNRPFIVIIIILVKYTNHIILVQTQLKISIYKIF